MVTIRGLHQVTFFMPSQKNVKVETPLAERMVVPRFYLNW